MKYFVLKEGFEIFSKSLIRKIRGIRKYSGNANSICKQIIKKCWNGKYFTTSQGHFNEFWVRDFGFCTKSLIDQGHKRKVVKTLEYVMDIFSKNNKIATTIDSEKIVEDFPKFSVDTIPWLLRSIRLSKAKYLLERHMPLFEREIEKFYNLVLNKRKKLVKEGHFSSIKDFAIRNSSTYDNTMLAMLKADLIKLKIDSPIKDMNIKEKMIKHLWNKTYFKDDLYDDTITADSNIFPFSTGVFTDKTMLKKAIDTLIHEGLENPLPISYSKTGIKNPSIYHFFVRNYQGTTIWTHMGPIFIKLVKKIYPKKAKEYKKKYAEVIEKHKNYLEVLNKDLTPFSNPYFMSDESMIWAVNYLNC